VNRAGHAIKGDEGEPFDFLDIQYLCVRMKHRDQSGKDVPVAAACRQIPVD
jgi:hypothetical protein